MRKPGYYWVKTNAGAWICAMCEIVDNKPTWFIAGEERYYDEEDFSEINETPITRLAPQSGDAENDSYVKAWKLAIDYKSTWKGHSDQEQYDFVNGAVAAFNSISDFASREVAVSDTEIFDVSNDFHPCDSVMRHCFINGAKWMRLKMGGK